MTPLYFKIVIVYGLMLLTDCIALVHVVYVHVHVWCSLLSFEFFKFKSCFWPSREVQEGNIYMTL